MLLPFTVRAAVPAQVVAELSRDLQEVCEGTSAVCADIIAAPPPLGWKPLSIVPSSIGKPFVDVSSLPEFYRVGVTCLDNPDYWILASQLGHELGHIFTNTLDERRWNCFAESVCTAISFLGLNALSRARQGAPPRENLRPHVFAGYREFAVSQAVSNLSVEYPRETHAWIRESLPGLLSRDDSGQDAETLRANRIADIISARDGCGSILTHLEPAVRPDHRVDFALWRRFCTSPAEQQVVDDIKMVFGPAYQSTA